MDHLQDDHGNKVISRSQSPSDDESLGLRRGPWTVDEDFTLINYIAHHGEGRWNSLARCAGLKRTGKSCRLRWLNYLRPDVRRGNITLEEQLLILELHSRWGNRWSKIAQHLPGRTDNEIKNYWRTRVQKHAKQLKCDVNSKQFKDTMRYLWMPRLVERIQAAAGSSRTDEAAAAALASSYYNNNNSNNTNNTNSSLNLDMGSSAHVALPGQQRQGAHAYTPDNSSAAASSDSFGTPVSDLTECYNNINQDNYYPVCNSDNNQFGYGDQTLTSPTGMFNQGLGFDGPWMDGGDAMWNVDDVWFLQQQFNGDA